MRAWKGSIWPALVLLAGTASYVVAFAHGRTNVPAASLQAHLPAAWGDWEGSDYALTDAEMKELQPDALVYRSYRNTRRGARPVGVLVLYWGSSAAKPHSPEICLTSADYTVFDEKPVRITSPGGEETVNTFRAERGMTQRVIYYWWYTDRGATADFGAFKNTTALRGILGKPSWGAFVRVEAAGLREEAPGLDADCRVMTQELLGFLQETFRAKGKA